MTIELSTPVAGDLGKVVETLRRWQRDDAPMQLHPGDLGWNWQFGPTAMAAALRLWRRGGTLLAVGLLDEPDVLRMTVAPEVWHDDEVADRLAADLGDPSRGVLLTGQASAEVPDTTLKDVLQRQGWSPGDAWAPLRLGLTAAIHRADLHVEVVTSNAQVSEVTAVHRSAWGSQRFTDTLWHTMATGSPYADARCLLARDADGVAVATLTVWSGGPGVPGLIEPLGVHADHRRLGYGAAICRAAGAHLQQMGASSAVVCTPTSNEAAVATYEAAGYQRMPVRLDLSRSA